MGKGIKELMSGFELFCHDYNLDYDFEKLGYQYKNQETNRGFIIFKYSENFKRELNS